VKCCGAVAGRALLATKANQPVARLTDQDVVVTAALDFLIAGI
jgi:hypothetical protein